MKKINEKLHFLTHPIFVPAFLSPSEKKVVYDGTLEMNGNTQENEQHLQLNEMTYT